MLKLSFKTEIIISFLMILIMIIIIVCSGSVVVTAYDSESGRPGSNPSLHPSGEVHWVPEQLNIKAVTGHAS